MSEAVIFKSTNTHQVLIVVVDTRVLGGVADSLQERRFASVSPTDHKNTKASILLSEVIGVAHGGCGESLRINFNGILPWVFKPRRTAGPCDANYDRKT